MRDVRDSLLTGERKADREKSHMFHEMVMIILRMRNSYERDRAVDNRAPIIKMVCTENKIVREGANAPRLEDMECDVDEGVALVDFFGSGFRVPGKDVRIVFPDEEYAHFIMQYPVMHLSVRVKPYPDENLFYPPMYPAFENVCGRTDIRSVTSI